MTCRELVSKLTEIYPWHYETQPCHDVTNSKTAPRAAPPAVSAASVGWVAGKPCAALQLVCSSSSLINFPSLFPSLLRYLSPAMWPCTGREMARLMVVWLCQY